MEEGEDKVKTVQKSPFTKKITLRNDNGSCTVIYICLGRESEYTSCD